MSTEEDTELRDLVAQTLEVNGCLPKIRAELRASIFLALDEDEKKAPLLNKKVKTQLESQEGRIMFSLVREFLEFFNLDYTISVYEPESYLGTGYEYEGRAKVIEDLGISQLEENSELPLLLQLIQIAQLKTVQKSKNIDIHLSKIQNETCKLEQEFGTGDTPYFAPSKKVVLNRAKIEVEDLKDTNKSSISDHSDISTSHSSNENSINGVLHPITEIRAVLKTNNLNETFEIATPTINTKETNKSNDKLKSLIDVIVSPCLLESSKSGSEEKEDTYDGTSSISEDSAKSSALIDLDKSTPNSDKSQSLSETEFSPPILKDSKSHSKFDMSFDKLKLSPQKTEKLKAKSSLSSLADLPPLQLNKSRNDTVLLPSLYSKEFKEKSTSSNLKELDKFFDVDVDSLDNYEEDFMSESEINLNKSLDTPRNNLLDELQSSSITDSNKNSSIKSAESKNFRNLKFQKSTDANQNSEKSKTEIVKSPKSANRIQTRDIQGTTSVATDEINLDVDDILNSPTSN